MNSKDDYLWEDFAKSSRKLDARVKQLLCRAPTWAKQIPAHYTVRTASGLDKPWCNSEQSFVQLQREQSSPVADATIETSVEVSDACSITGCLDVNYVNEQLVLES